MDDVTRAPFLCIQRPIWRQFRHKTEPREIFPSEITALYIVPAGNATAECIATFLKRKFENRH